MTARLVVVVATALAAVIALSVGARRPDSLTLRATAGGAMQLGNSRDDQAILSTSGLRPGTSVEGSLTLTNLAGAPQRLSLSMSDLEDVPGAGGGVLSQRLDLLVERGGDVVFTGKLADLESLDLGELAPGSSEPYRFVVALPEGGTAIDNAYAGGRVEVAWSWRGDVDGDAPAGPGGPERPERPDVSPSGGGERSAPEPPASEPSVDELVGPAPDARGVRMWLGGRRLQAIGRRSSFAVLARCRPDCSVDAIALVRGGGGRRLAAVRLRGAAVGAGAARLRFALRGAALRRVRSAAGAGPVTVTVKLLARADGRRGVAKTRTLRLRP